MDTAAEIDSNQKKERVSTECIICASKKLRSSLAILMPFIAHRIFGWAPVQIDEAWELNTIKNGNAYSICKSLYCENCTLLFLDIRFSENELKTLYQDYRGKSYTALREFYEPGYLKRNLDLDAGVEYVEQIENFLKPHLSSPIKMLDWGGDTGKNSPFKANAEVFDIYDISSKEVVKGATVVSKSTAFSKKYNLVICANVLEHVSYPIDLLNDIKKVMTPEAVLYVEVPLEDVVRSFGSDAYLKKKHWHEHINFFSEDSLRYLITSVGFQVLALDTLQVTVAGKSCHIFQVACKLK